MHDCLRMSTPPTHPLKDTVAKFLLTHDAGDDGSLLDGRWFFKAIGVDPSQQGLAQVHVIKRVTDTIVVALGGKKVISTSLSYLQLPKKIYRSGEEVTSTKCKSRNVTILLYNCKCADNNITYPLSTDSYFFQFKIRN